MVLTEERAREIVSEIYKQTGGLSNIPAELSETTARSRIIDNRFIYEFIQHAENSSYSEATSQREEPFLIFRFNQNRITVDSNSDGLEESDIRAIWSAGKSRKKGKTDEKGNVFRSAFRIAQKVQIQSGQFCFSIRHREGEHDPGMATPVNEPHQALPDFVRTRFTLSHIYSDQYQGFGARLNGLPHAIIAFLSTIKTVRFSYFSSAEGMISKTFHQCLEGSSLKLTVTQDGIATEHNYITFRKQVTASAGEGSLPKEVDMVLAFPLDEQKIDEQPCVYAGLPLRKVGLNFLVQSDFETEDNKLDFAVCPWNDSLLHQLPKVFCPALERLCSRTDVERFWPLFLPKVDAIDPHWCVFFESVQKELKRLHVFKTAKGALKSQEKVRYLAPECCDCHGNPLIEDSAEDFYLAPQYAEYHEILKPFGLQPVSTRQLLDRLYPYLEGVRPRYLYDKQLDNDWHNRVASLLLSWMYPPTDPVAMEVEQLCVVPITSGTRSSLLRLESPKKLDIYFPHDISGNRIPDPLNSVPIASVVDGPRKQLFAQLGVKQAGPAFVIEQICEWNTTILVPTLDQAIRNLRYMFLAATDQKLLNAQCILLYDVDGKLLAMPRREFNEWLRDEDVYFKTEDKYGMSAVLQYIQSRFPDQEHPHIQFLHPDYTTQFQPDAAWARWLAEVGPIRYAPRLQTQGSPAQPAEVLLYIVGYAPELMIEILKEHWEVYKEELANAAPETVSVIKHARVPVECGTETLAESFLGTSEQRSLWSGEHLTNRFPFLTISFDWKCEDRFDWEFLSRFGVVTTITSKFLIASAKELSRVLPRQHAKEGFFKLYEILAEDAFEAFWEHAPTIDLVYIPRSGPDDQLVRIADCAWDVGILDNKHVLASHVEYALNPKVEQLFRRVLNSDGADWATCLSKLSRLQKELTVSQEFLNEIYRNIMEGSQDDHGWRTIRDRFETSKLIYSSRDTIWRPPSLCVWSACPYIGGKHGIRDIYPNLDRLFVDGLQVSAPAISTYVDEIRSITMGNINRNEMLVVIKELSSLGPTAQDVEPLKFVKFLPVRNRATRITYVTVDEPFFISDDDRLQLDPAVPVLDFGAEDVRRSRRFLSALGLEKRFVSGQIVEKTLTVSGAEESAELTEELRQKAESLFRCTLQYGSPRSLHPEDTIRKLFSHATVYTATGFRRYFGMNDGLMTEVGHEGRLHFEEVGGAFRLYVPRDRKQRSICYATELPEALVRCLQIDDKAACGMFATVLRHPADTLDAILDEKGIIRPSAQLEPISLKASDEYIRMQNDRLPYLEALEKKYNFQHSDIGAVNETSVLSEYLKFKRADRTLSIIEAALKAAAETVESDQMTLLLDYLRVQGQAITISEAVLEAAARNEICGQDNLALLLRYSQSCGRFVDITASTLQVAARNEPQGLKIMRLLLEYADDRSKEVNINAAVLKAAVENTESGDDLLALILEHQDTVPITQEIVIAAAENLQLGHEIVNLLLIYDGAISTTPALLEAAAGNPRHGLRLITLLLRDGRKIVATEDLIISAVYNDDFGVEILTFLQDHNIGPLLVSEKVLLATVESENSPELIDLFMRIHGGNLPITDAVLEAAASSPECDDEYFARLLELSDSDIQFTEEIMIRAVHDSEKISLMVDTGARITEKVLIAAAGKVEWCLERSLLDGLQDQSILITDAVLEAAAGNPVHGLEAMTLLLDYWGQDIRISERVLLAAAANPDGPNIIYLLFDRDPDLEVTEAVMIAATGAGINMLEELLKRWPAGLPFGITEALLDAIAGSWHCGARALRLLLEIGVEDDIFPVTNGTLIKAACNTHCGYEVTALLLDHGGEDVEAMITEDVLIAAVGNSLWGLEILALLLDRGNIDTFSMNVLTAAERNVWCGEEMMAMLLRHQVGEDGEVRLDGEFCEGADVSDDSSEGTEVPVSAYSSDVYDTAGSD
ncbi:uncharacterized protein DSM5745_07316 [Aspergillus mulundensis]|uniref:Uncharacterized protein n=1 Tax=Aspergillus mulundensis TaxID=1810919 RepID=A0A3D8RL68_9EURO|nr:hypothetical protein DSM5745_07316 [Aspergillus mulundensis]RDW74654.1 hypothetical protein DSM5745_07316 [Aspergillus mulundensis]